MIKGKRTLTLQVEVTVELGDVEYSTPGEWSALYHDKATTDRATAYVGAAIKNDITTALNYETIKVDVSRGKLDIINDEKNEALDTAMHNAEEAEEQARADAVEEVLTKAGVTEPFCWAMGKSADDALIAGDLFQEGKVRFEYDGGWGHSGRSPVYLNPTYVQLAVTASKLRHLSEDEHHIFLESAIRTDVDENDVQVYSLSFGS